VVAIVDTKTPGSLHRKNAYLGGIVTAIPYCRACVPASTTELIGMEIRHEYILGYVPSGRKSDGKFHKIRVKVEPPPGQHFQISNRAGYYAPIR